MFSVQFFVVTLLSFSLFFTFVCGAPAKHGANVKGLGIPISNPDAKDIIAGKYIVVYHNNATDDAVQLHQSSIKKTFQKRGLSLENRMRTFSMSGWRGMAVLAEDDGMVIDIANADEVNYVEAVTKISTQQLMNQANSTRGLARISHKTNITTGYIFDSSAGAGITAYVVDTGILTTHSEFEGRATFGANFANSVDTDENGHGSHVSGTIGGKTFGVAKSVSLVAVKVLGADGSGSVTDMISGLQFVLKDVAAKNLTGKAIVNMSLGGSKSNAVNSAINALTRAGVPCVVAAGNDAADAQFYSPASTASAITVGAIDTADKMAYFSNFGTSLDIFAPGTNVLSVGITSNDATDILSGTSMASPHVAGLGAYLMALEDITDPVALVSRIQTLAGTTNSTVRGVAQGTITLIAYNGNGLDLN